MQYRICPLCGAHLDPGERCDCQEKEKDDDAPKHRRPQSPKGDQ